MAKLRSADDPCNTLDQIPIPCKLVSLHKLAALELITGPAVLGNHLDPIASIRIDHVEADGSPVMTRIEKRDRAGDKRQTKVTAPYWTGCHALSSLNRKEHNWTLGSDHSMRIWSLRQRVKWLKARATTAS
jgi:hypothetical protein